MDDLVAAAKGGVSSIELDRWAHTLHAFSNAHEGTWALTPVSGLENKLLVVRIVLQLLHHTVGVNGKHRGRSLDLEVEREALLAARILLRERQGAESLMSNQAIELYVHAARENGDASSAFRVSLMALKCLNNAVWDQPAGQACFVRLGGLDMLLGLLQASRPASVMYFACRILNIIGNCDPEAFLQLRKSHDVFQILVSVLVCCVRCADPLCPGEEYRLKLTVQVLQGLFLLGVRFTPEEKCKALQGHVMVCLGHVLVDILHLDHGDLDAFMAKLQVLNLLLDMPDGFAEVLIGHKCVPRILQLVELQLTRQAFQEGRDMDAAAELTPALLVLHRLVAASEEARLAVKTAVFPPEDDQVWMIRLEQEQNYVSSLTGEAKKRAEKAMKEKRVHPVDAPRASFRSRLMKHMTATESSSKTAVSDLLYNLCDDEDEFTTRCGFGNAVNTLRLKGRISMPGVG